MFAHFMCMIDYFGLTFGVYGFELAQIAPPEVVNGEIVPDHYSQGVRVMSKQNRTFYLKPVKHNMNINGFEVCVGEEVSSLQVGWLYPSVARTGVSSPPYLSALSDAVCLDVKGTTTSVAGQTLNHGQSFSQPIGEGTTILCQHLNYSFQVGEDGTPFSPSNNSRDGCCTQTSTAQHVPAISGTGSWSITRVFLDY